MRTFMFLLAMRTALAFHCPPACECQNNDELNVVCKLRHANVTLDGQINEYVNVRCEGTNFTCADLPDFGYYQTLSNLGVTSCPPHLLRCVEQLQATGVSSLYLTDVSGPLTDDDVAKLGAVEDITISDGLETKIPVAALSKLPKLRSLRISDTPVRLNSDEFLGFPAIQYLELSSAKIPEIPDDAFNGLSKLTTLNIWGNNFSDVSVNLFKGLNSLVKLTLNKNNISSLAPGCFSHTPQLASVMWDDNAVQELPAGVFYNLTRLENITLQVNAVELKLHPKSLSQLSSLKNLFLEYMKIKSLPDDLFTGNTAIEKLSLKHNDIATLPVKLFQDLISLVDLDLSYNIIRKVESGLFLRLKQLKYLNLNRNSLHILPDDLFSGLKNLNTVTIEHNFLHTISTSTFHGASIHTLSLAGNHLTLIDQDQAILQQYFNFDLKSPFSVLTELKKLLLSQNKISTIFHDWQTVLLQLEVLDLSFNNFTQIDPNDMQFLSHNSINAVTVDLRYNNITSINMSQPKINLKQLSRKNITLDLRYNHISSITLNNPNQSSEDQSHNISSPIAVNCRILIENNPLNCDCRLYTLSMRLKGAKSLVFEPRFVVGNASCESPELLKGKLFTAVSPYDLNCDLTEENCPDDCSCKYKPATKNLDLECNNLPRTLPKPENFSGAKYLSVKLLKSPQSLNSLSVDLLNLTGIGLKDIPFAPSENVTRIDFSNNSLTTVPVEFLSANTTLYLSENHFECDCWHSNEIAILKNSNLIKDSEYLTCSDGRRLSELDVSSLCSAYNAAIIATETFVVLLIIATILSIAIYRNKHEVFILLSRIFPCIFTDDLTDSDKEYDLFISYAHNDSEYLRKLLPRLENDFKQKTCLHYRDWSIGDLIPEQINRSVKQSRRTIILLSKNSLESAYANMEFRAAHNYALQEGRTRVILILLEDVTDYECLLEELRAYIKTNTYLSWDDPRFWERLQKALPRKNAKKFIWPEIFKRRVNQELDVPLDTLREN